MAMLLAFLPFIVFVVVERLVGILPGLLAAAGAALVALLRDVLAPGRAPKLLEIGTAVLFAGLALATLLAGVHWTIVGVRLAVDAGLCAIVLVSLAIGRPFTRQYAREQVAPEVARRPEFQRANMVITAVWAAAFALMVAADVTWVFLPRLPPRVGVVVTVAALVGAIRFTAWYPARLRRAAEAAGSATAG